MIMDPCDAGERQSTTTASSDASADSWILESTADENATKISNTEKDQKLTKLGDIVNSFVPVIKELKTACDAASQHNDAELSHG